MEEFEELESRMDKIIVMGIIKKILVVCTTDSMIWNFLIPHIQEFQKRGYEVECACSKTGFYFEELTKKYGFFLHEIHVKRFPFNFKNFTAYKELVKIIKHGGFDNIFCHEPMGGVLGRLTGKRCGCSVYYMAHGFHFYKGVPLINKVVYYSVEYLLSFITDVVITINTEDFEASKHLHSKKVFKTHGIGVDTQKFQKDITSKQYLNEMFNLNSNVVKVLTVGEMIIRKNQEVLIKAIALLPDNIHLFIAGSGELDNHLKKLAKRISVSDRVHFLGFRKDIRLLCSSSDIFAFPSLQEGLSVALMEAMGCEMPVVASNIRGNNDLIIEGKGGYLIDGNNPSVYKTCIYELSNDETLRTNFGRFNNSYVREFDTKVVVEELKEFYP